MGEAAPAAGFPAVLPPAQGSGPTPRLHSAIVERLRARIELCRRHHSACENRYARGQAEISDREREATLQLLSMVQQGAAGGRRSKERGARGGAAHGAEASRSNGEQKHRESGDAEPRLATRIALQGSLRRKIEGQPSGFAAKQNGHFCVGSTQDFKRLRMDTGSVHPGSCTGDMVQSRCLTGSLALGHAVRRNESFVMNRSVANDLFNTTLRDMKKEPVEVQTCSHSSVDPAMMVFDLKDESGGQIDPELQDLFDELTKSVPPLNDHELEKMLKQDDDFGLDLGRPSSAGATNPCPLLDKPIKTEYSPDFGQAPVSSPQLRPSSAGPSFAMTNNAPPIVSAPVTHSHVPQTSGASSRGLPAWPEMSHAEQLKQMAANQQPKPPSNSLLHHQQQNQAGGVRNWPAAIGGHPNSFCQDTITSTGSLSQTRISPQSSGQSKGMTNCLFKSGAYNPSNPPDIKTLNSKPMLHFTPKTSTTGQQMPHVATAQSKPTVHPQQAAGAQNMPFQLSMPSTCLQPKTLNQRLPQSQHGPAMNFKINHQRQVLASAPRFTANGCLVSQQRAAVPNTQQINNSKGQRQLSQAQHHSSDTEKFTSQDQFSRHLTRPPPDYKQAQGVAGAQHHNLYQGLRTPSLTTSNADQSDFQSLSCQISNGPGVKMTSSADGVFHTRSDHHSGPLEVQNCASHLHQQPNNQVHQNKSQFQGMVPTTQPVRTAAGQEAVLGCMASTTTREPGMSWGTVPKQLDIKRHPSTVPPQGAQSDAHFSPRPIGPPNQVVPHSGMISLNPGVRGSAPRAPPPHIPPLPGISGLNQSSPGCVSTFGGPAHSPSAFQNNRTGRLTFDFLQDGDNTVPGINADSDFIDSLLKSGPGNDDWMKDINLEEILGGHS